MKQKHFILILKGDSINIDLNLFQDTKRYCNKIWQAIRYFEMSVDPKKKASFRLMDLNEVRDLKETTTNSHNLNFFDQFFFKNSFHIQ